MVLLNFYYTDGTSENVKVALAAGHITIADLDANGIGYGTIPKE